MGDLPLRTPIHRRLGEPLPHQLPNGTHAHPRTAEAFNKYPHAGALFYPVLIRLSPGCPDSVGRLHTRYAPVRRSPPRYCYPVLPLDLHVLSLSLAFILSQDQTLRCRFCLFYFFLSPFTPEFIAVVSPVSRKTFDGRTGLASIVLALFLFFRIKPPDGRIMLPLYYFRCM